MLQNIFNSSIDTIVISPSVVILNLVFAFILSLIIALVYKHTHKGLSYSQTFVMTLIMTGIIIAGVMMAIGNNIARAFGAFGAFSLIRFRTAIKDAKDMGYIFLVLAVGMAVGTGNYTIAASLAAVVLLIVYILTKMNFGSIRKFDYILNFNLDTRQSQENIYKTTFDKYLKTNNILNIKTTDQGRVLQLSFSVKFLSEKDLSKFTSELEQLPGVKDIALITAKNDVEY